MPAGIRDIGAGIRDLIALDEQSIAKSRRIFVNRNLKMKSIRYVGFDMDHTLAVYAKEPIEKLAFDETKKKMVEDKGYPRELLKLDYDPDFVIRGLVVDKVRGNNIKMDKHKYVAQAFHGKRMMSRSERKVTYANKRLTIYDADYRSIDTLFSLPEADLFAQIIDLVELGGVECKIPYSQIFDDIRASIDKAHQDGSIKVKVVADLGRYFVKDPKLPLALDKFIKAGKKLFLLTNSGLDYTEHVLDYLLSGELEDYPDWKDYFDLVIIDAEKPRFFADGSPMAQVETGHVGPGGRGQRIFRKGSATQMETLLGARGEELLYFGDHTHADILKSKKTSGWRTAMIIEELEHEITAAEEVQNLSEELNRIYETNSELRFQSNMLEEKVAILKETKRQDYTSLGANEMAKIDKDIEGCLRRVIRIEQKMTEQFSRAKALEDEVEKAFNVFWGQLFKSGRENSRFGDQVEDFACVYTSRVSNLLHYPVNKYFQTARELMPHET